MGLVLDDPHRHRMADDAGHRTERAALVTRRELELAGLGPADGVVGIVGDPFEQRRTDHGAAHRARHVSPGNRRAGVQEGARRHPEQELSRRADADDERSRLLHTRDCGVVRASDPVGVGGEPG